MEENVALVEFYGDQFGIFARIVFGDGEDPSMNEEGLTPLFSIPNDIDDMHPEFDTVADTSAEVQDDDATDPPPDFERIETRLEVVWVKQYPKPIDLPAQPS